MQAVRFKQAQNTSGDYNLVVGAYSAGTCSGALLKNMPLVYDGIGAEKGLSTCIDPAVLGLVQYPSRLALATGAASGLPAVPLPDQVSSITATAGTTYTVSGTPVFGISFQAPLWSIFRTGAYCGLQRSVGLRQPVLSHSLARPRNRDSSTMRGSAICRGLLRH